MAFGQHKTKPLYRLKILPDLCIQFLEYRLVNNIQTTYGANKYESYLSKDFNCPANKSDGRVNAVSKGFNGDR